MMENSRPSLPLIQNKEQPVPGNEQQPVPGNEQQPVPGNELQALVEEEQPVGQDISCLPSEILTIIFCYLDVASNVRAARVCHHWRQLVRHQSLWRNVQVEVQVEGSNLSHCSIYRPPCPYSSSNPLPGLRIPHWLPHLTNMSFDMLYNKQNPSTIACVHDLALRYPNLVSLTLNFNKENGELADASMGVIRDHLKSLKHLYLTRGSGITDAGIARLAGWNSQDDGFPQLLSLGLDFYADLTDQSFLYLSDGQRSLKHLRIQCCGENITNTALEYMSRMPRLVQLWIAHDDFGLSDAGFKHLKRLETLKELHLEQTFVEMWLRHLADVGSKISTLRLGFKYGINRIMEANEIGVYLAQLVHLEVLLIIGREISNFTLSRLTTTRIRVFIFDECQGITADSLKHLASMTHLRELEFHNCGINDDGLANLADGRSGITCLTIFLPYSSNVTDIGMKHLARLADLTKLCLWHCHDVSDAGLAYLRQGVARITDLHVDSNHIFARPLCLYTFGGVHKWRKFFAHRPLHRVFPVNDRTKIGFCIVRKPLSYKLVYVH